MDHDLQPEADELIRTLGQLGLAQENSPNPPDVTVLTRHAVQLHELLALTNGEG